MSQDAAIDTKKVQDMFPTMGKGLGLIKKGSKVDSEEHKKAEDLRRETDDLKDQWSQITNVKDTPPKNNKNKNITKLIQRILKVCSEVVDLLKGIKKYLVDPIIDKIIISLKEGMQYCSQLLSGASKHKSNDITTPAARGNSADLQNATLPSHSTSEIQASTTTPALTNSSTPNIAGNVQPKAAHAINNTQNSNIAPPPPPPPSSLINSIQSDPANIKTNNTAANLPTPPAMDGNLLAEIRAGTKLKPTPQDSTDQKPSSKDSLKESMKKNVDEMAKRQIAEHQNSVFTPINSEDDWETDVDREIKNTDTPSQENRASSAQPSHSNSIANTLPDDKKQMSHVEREQKKRTLNESKQQGKSL